MVSLKADGLTQVVVTHEMSFARVIADRAGHLEEGRIARCGAPDEVLSRAFAAPPPSPADAKAGP